MRSVRKKPIQHVPKSNQFPGYDSFTLLQRLSDNRKIYYDQHLSRKVECCHLVLDKKNLKDWKEMYNWRSKTQLPIVNILFFEFLEQNHNEIKLNIFNQYCPQRLSDFSEIPLNQILYLMKQSLIGFERLYSKINGFEVNSNMIAINDSKKCKVWLHEDFAKNDTKRIQIDEQQYLCRIINIYSAFVVRTSLSRQFFQGFTIVKQFLQAFTYIDMFASKYRILIPSRFAIEPQENRKFSFYYRPKFYQKQPSAKKNDNSTKKMWKQAQQIIIKKNSNISTHFSELSEKISNHNFMKYSNGTNGTTEVTSINQINLMNPMQISLVDEDFQGSKQDYYCASSQENRSYQKTQHMFRSEINQLDPKIIENQQKLSSGYRIQMKLKVIKKSHQLSSIQECKQKNADKIQKLWNPTNITAQQQDSYQEQNSFQQEIFRKNGWANKINNLITVGKQIKQSVTIGKDIHSAVKLRKLELLNRFGRNIGNSRVHDITQ